MKEFFDNRVDSYDEYMKNNVDNYDIYYSMFGEYLNKNFYNKNINILDLGAGTGIELKNIFKHFPESKLTALDISDEMLKKLKEKYDKYNIETVKESYLRLNKLNEKFNCIISSMTMHHYFGDKKLKIFQSIYNKLKKNGIYIEGDYFSKNQYDQDKLIKEFLEKNISEEDIHFDIPLTIENEIKLLNNSGFGKIEIIYENNKKNYIITAKK